MKLDILFHYNVDEQTGIVTYIGKEEIKVDTFNKTSLIEDKEPKLYLQDNKCVLNNAAITLMEVKVGDKIDIRYEGNNSLPIIGTDEALMSANGCKLTKQNTFLCKGPKHDALIKYGNEFTISKHPDKINIFVLNNSNIDDEPEAKEQSVIKNVDTADLDLDSLLSNEDEKTEINSNFFKF